MACYPYECESCGHEVANFYVPLFSSPDPACPRCPGGPMKRLIGLPTILTDANFSPETGGGRFYNKVADEWQDRSRHRAWKKEMEAKGCIVGEGPTAGRRRERHQKIGDKIGKYGPEYAKATRKQFQAGGRKRLDMVD